MPLPDGSGDRLTAVIAAASALGVELDETEAERLLRYLDLLRRWNATYNLTAVRDPQDMLVQHLYDCLAVITPLRRVLGDAGRVLDVGSGGGLPGVVIAACLPAVQVTCVDTVGKKAAFIRQASAELGLPNLRGEQSRVESLKLAPFDVVASRAFSALEDFVRLTRHLAAPTGFWMAMKGKRPDDEIAALPPDVDMFHVEQLAVPGLNADRCLVWIRQRVAQSS
jgi:16S rRNA (guanine527-N7)-methyltransferase